MTVTLIGQALWVVSAWALWTAALRVAHVITGDREHPFRLNPADVLLAAAPLAAAFAVLWTLALGRLGLADRPLALAAGPVGAWILVRRLLPAPRRRLLAELAEWFADASRASRSGVLLGLGLLAGCSIEIARQPGFDVDALSYHLADVVGWVHSGHAGTAQTFSYDFPVGYYPVTGEVLLTWVLGISRSFAPLALWSPFFWGLGALGTWRLLDAFRIPRAAAAATTVALWTLPVVMLGLNFNGPGTDLPALAWLAGTAALSCAARECPALLVPALVAAGLGIGTKTTVAPLCVVALAAGAWHVRHALRSRRGYLLGSVLTAALVSVPWYARATISHGWPLWPFNMGPTGDPLPRAMQLFHASFISRPVATFRALGAHSYLTWLAGGLGLLAGVPAAVMLVRTRPVKLASAAALGAVLLWAAAPFTGVPHNPLLAPLTVSTLRYMASALGACALTLALAARDGSRAMRSLFTALLALCALASIVSDLGQRFPEVPTPSYLAAGAAVGALLGLLAGRARHGPLEQTAGAIVAAALVVAFLTASAPNWLWRESQRATYRAPLLAFMLRQPGFASGSQPVGFAPAVVATLAGPRLRHGISLIGAREPCRLVRARLLHGWVVVFPRVFAAGITTAFDAPSCLRRVRPIYDDGDAVVYGGA